MRHEFKRWENRQEQMRRRIVEAAVELHCTVGPARTSISAIAERARVERLTVYRHFPDERTLIEACTQHGFATMPPPDPISWRRIGDAETRLRLAIGELYAYYRRTEPAWVNVLHDAETMPIVAEIGVTPYSHYLEGAREILAVGWNVRGRRRTALLATLGLILDFQAWRSLARRQGLDDEQAVDLAVSLVCCAARAGTSRATPASF